MNAAEIGPLIIGALQGLTLTSVFILVLFIGFSVVFGFPKLRATGRQTMIVRSLDELVGPPLIYLPPNAPRGRVDQLHTPELQEAAARKVS